MPKDIFERIISGEKVSIGDIVAPQGFVIVNSKLGLKEGVFTDKGQAAARLRELNQQLPEFSKFRKIKAV